MARKKTSTKKKTVKARDANKSKTDKTKPKNEEKTIKIKDTKIGQPEVSIGLVGHVDHGKTTLTQCLSGRWTDKHSEEIKRGITIRLGYADAVFYKCPKCKPDCYVTSATCPNCKSKCKPLRKVSFVDAPGHETLMATMISGAAIMDGALLLVAANEPCPQPQTKEHLMALNIIGVKNIVIVQNKIDLVSEEEALKNYEQIKKFVKGTIAENAPIIPVSAQHDINISTVIEAIEEVIKIPKRVLNKTPLMFAARSFDVNKPGTKIENLIGGVLGGALKQGVFKIGDEIEIKPGLKKEKEGKVVYQPITSKVVGLKTGGESVDQITPGGSVGMLTLLDPSIVKADSLAGNVVGLPGKLPKVWYEFDLEPHLLERVVGINDDLLVEAVKEREFLMLNANSSATIGVVDKISKNLFHVMLRIPVCCDNDDRITISRKLGDRWRLIGWGQIKS
ncbi:MAG: translation initiation factor IF-2 subunit gamma [Nanoarchaeota archaeon]|nr:translation initiation factor IF-2 subunit gamma [Nanoarchaeota archaeon]